MLATTQGIYSESIFASECLKRYIEVSKPITDKFGYDFIIKNGCFKTVQVKSTNRFHKETKNATSYKIQLTKGANDRCYEKSDFDYLAVYIIPANIWYIIPHELINTKTLRFNPDSKKCKWFSYKNKWDLLSAGNHP